MNCLDALGFSASAMAEKSGARVLGDAQVEKGDVRKAGAAQDERGGTREAGGVRVSRPAPLVAAIGGGGKTTAALVGGRAARAGRPRSAGNDHPLHAL